MLPASNRGAGQSIGFPDVCLTPAAPAPIPVPYPNIGMNAQALGFSPLVKIAMVNALHLGSKIAMTSGDEAGSAHPTVKGGGTYTMGNPLVFIDNLPGICLLCPTTGNNMNNPLGAVLVPSAVNVLYTLRLDRGATEGLAQATGDALHAASVTSVRLEPGGVGVIAIARCAADLAPSVVEAAVRLEEAGARALLLDLRGNRGGELEAAVALASALLPEGALITRLVDGDGDATDRVAVGPARCLLPMVAVVDRRTASASELLVSALRGHGRAVVVGEATHGKGWAWRLDVDADGRAELRCAARWTAPDGTSVDGLGVAPDLALAAEGGHDVLAAAIAIARELVAPPA